MTNIDIQKSDSLAVVTLSRGKVNAFNSPLVDELRAAFLSLESDRATRAIVLTGNGPFFSFGFDVPELYDLPPDTFAAFLHNFSDLSRYLFTFPKPLVAAINGHAVAGGCILATACDRRLMISGKPRISLNELTFGSTIFQTAIELMRYWVGSRVAEQVLFGGAMYSAEDARSIGLIDAIVDPENLLAEASATALRLCGPNPDAFAHVKSMLRRPIIDRILSHEAPTIERFVEIWYSAPIRASLRQITIR